MGALRILIGDDHTLFRHGLLKILEERPEWTVVAEAGDGRECVRQAMALQPDVAVLDIGMPLLNGIEATRQIARRIGSVGVLILSMHADEPYIMQALQAGARGYLLKSAPREELLHAIRAVAAGERYLPPALAHRLAERVSGEDLTARELEVLRLIGGGRSNKEIGAALHIAEDTVKRHVSNLFAKLKVADRAQATAEAIRRGFIRL